MDQFYVTLPSNTQTDLNNTQAKYTVRLPQRITLQGDWECGLCQFIYPHNWLNIAQKDLAIRVHLVNSDTIWSTEIPIRYYESITDLVDAINWKLQNTQMPNNNSVHIGKHIKFEYYPNFHRVGIVTDADKIEYIEITDTLRYVLGFSKTIKLNKTAWAENLPDIHNGFETLYIYCNIIEPQIVGDVVAPLIRIANVDGRYPDVVDKTYDFPHYLPVLVKDITAIEINIKDDLNELIPFISGKVIVKLHFRRIKHSYF